MTWLSGARGELAADRILDAAGRCFAERGVAAVGMAEIAAAAGCSRATLYRYFDDRNALRIAFVHRGARRLAAGVGRQVAGIDDPVERLVAAVEAAVAAVRSDAALHAWFTAEAAGIATELTSSSAVIESIAAAFLGGAGDEAAARWVVRVVLSLLAMPGADAGEERALVARFVAPVVLSRAAPARRP